MQKPQIYEWGWNYDSIDNSCVCERQLHGLENLPGNVGRPKMRKEFPAEATQCLANSL